MLSKRNSVDELPVGGSDVEKSAITQQFKTPIHHISGKSVPFDPGLQASDEAQTKDSENAVAQPVVGLQPLRNTNVPPSPPVDGGSTAWLQVLMGHLMNFNTWGYINSYGLFAGYYIDNLHLGASAVAWTGSIQIFLLCFIGTFSGRALDAGYHRHVVTLGCFFQLLGIFMASFADQYWQIFLAQGLCQGIGNGLVFTPTVGLVSTYFAKKRSIAIGLMLSGSVTGGIAFPLMAQHLLPTLGFPWTVRIMGFVALFNVIVILLLARTRIAPRKSGPLFELSAFKEGPYSLFTAGTFLCLWPVYLSYDYINVFATSIIRTSTSNSLTFLLLLNAAGFPGRIIPALLADLYLGPLNVLLLLMISGAIMFFLWICVSSLSGLYVFTIFFGFIMGGIQGLFITALSSLTKDLSKMGTRMGMIFTVLAFSTLTGAPIGGALIDVLGGGFLALQIWGGISMVVGTAVLIAARTAETGWIMRKRM